MTNSPRTPGQTAPASREGSTNTPSAALVEKLGALPAAAGVLKAPEIKLHRKGEVATMAELMPDAKLPAGGEKKLHAPFTDGTTMKDGKVAGVMGVVLAGDVAVAVVGSYDTGTGRAAKVSLVELAVGMHSKESGAPATGRLIDEIDVTQLDKPREDGVVVPWQDRVIGREDVGHDGTVSRAHFTVTVGREGDVSIRDGATSAETNEWRPASNGTYLLDGQTYSRLGDGTVPAPAANLLTELGQEPLTWLPDHAQQHATIVHAQ